MSAPNLDDETSKGPRESDAEETDELFNMLLENVPDRIYFKDKESRFIRVNRAKAERHRISDPFDLVGKTDFDLFTVEHAQQALQDEQEIMRTGKGIVGRVEKETLPDGSVRWALTTSVSEVLVVPSRAPGFG